MNRSLTPADHLLFLCARARWDETARAAAGACLDAGVDWPALLDTGRRHGLLPLLHDRLATLDRGRAPADVGAQLRGSYCTSLLRNRRLAAELARVAAALHRAGVDVIVLKGGALAPTVYDHPAQRPMTDLDLLVPPGQAGAAATVLEAEGYHPSGSVPAHMLPFQQRFGGGVEWLRREEGTTTRLDVQHDLVGVDWCRGLFRVAPEALWAAARPLHWDGAEALQLSAEDTLVHLCLHPAVHHGYASSLLGYADLDRLVERQEPASFWPGFVERAGRLRVRTAAYRGLLGARHLLGTPVPDEVLRALAPGALQARALARLAPLDAGVALEGAGRDLHGLRQVLLYAALADRPPDAVGMAAAILFPPREWLAARYGLPAGTPAWRARLAHPLRVGRALARSLDRPLVQSGLD